MLVWLLQTGEPTPAPGHDGKHFRTRMLASALAERGHRVLWWTSTFDHYAKRHVADVGEMREIESGVTVLFLPAFAYARNLSLRRYVSHIRTARAFRRAAEREPVPDLIVTSMPDYFLAAKAVSYGRARGVPVVVDVRDQWPDVFLEALPRWSRPLAAAALAPDRAKLRRLLHDADATTSVIDSVLSWAIERTGRERRAVDRVFYLGSDALPAPDPSRVSAPVRHILQATAGRLVVVFAGTFGLLTRPNVIVEAAQRMARDGDTAKRLSFVLAGEGPGSEAVRRAAGGLDNVYFPGWVEGDDLAALLGAASVGIAASAPGHDTFPNKAFTYLAAGLPLLDSGEGELAKLAGEHGFGRAFRAGDAGSLAGEIRSLQEHPDEVEQMGKAARRFFVEECESSRIYPRFAEYLEEIAATEPGKSIR